MMWLASGRSIRGFLADTNFGLGELDGLWFLLQIIFIRKVSGYVISQVA